MVEVTSPHTIYSFDIPYLCFYHALINYVVHSKLELKFASQKAPYISKSNIKLGLDESIRFRLFEFS
jgi:hypothetical protein